MVGARTHVADLSDPVLSELVLHVQVPLHNDGYDPPRSRGLHRAADIDGVARGYSRGEAAGDKLRCCRGLTGVEVLGHKGELSRVESEIVENIRLARVEDSKGASDHSVPR